MSAFLNKKLFSSFVFLLFCALLIVNFMFWLHAKNIRTKWGNVPPAPSAAIAGLAGLGDDGIAYRLYGFFLQNLGNTGGNYESLKAYDYAALESWLFLTQSLDGRSNYVPLMAAYYFGAVQDSPDKIAHLSTYLASNGALPYPEKWRWLAQAVYLARYKEKNLEKALDYANTLASLDVEMAPWARQMPAFVKLKMGDKRAAYEIMVRMLSTEGTKLPPQEINAMKDFICNRTLEKSEAGQNPLCQTDK